MKQCKFIHPESFVQSTNESITESGLYDLHNFSKHEIDTIVAVLHTAYSDKYPTAVRSLGLLNEAYPIIYKPRYILLELIIQLFNNSNKSYDLLAVAEAYRLKGAAFRKQALEHYERYLARVNVIQSRYVKNSFAICTDLILWNNISELYEKEHNFYRALKYAELAESLNTDNLPYYPIHISKILLKIDPEKSVTYLSEIVKTKKYKSTEAVLISALSDAQRKASTGYRFRPKTSRTEISDFDVGVEAAAIEFLPGGKYYALWAK